MFKTVSQYKISSLLLLLAISTVMSCTPGKKVSKDNSSAETVVKTKESKIKQNKDIVVDSIPIRNDSLGLVLSDSIVIDSANQPTREITYSVSKDSIDAPVEYSAEDSMIYDIEHEKIYLYGQAKIAYQELTLSADYIIFDFKNKIAEATFTLDSTGAKIGLPEFNDKANDQAFTSQKLRYNFESKKGKVYKAVTQEGDGYLLANESVFIAKDAPSNDTGEDIVYSKSGLYTTCDHPEPHFGIRASKAKVIPNKLIVIGPSFLEIEGIPTPLGLPFGFFPITKGRKSGLILPRDYETSPALGFGLKDVGYYFGINDNFDLRLSGSIYTRGSWGLKASSNYKKRYNSSGAIAISVFTRKIDEPETPDYVLQRDFNISWTHRQDPGAHPTQNFSGGVNFGTGSYYSNTRNDAESVLQNTLNSNLTYTKRWPGKPFTFTAAFAHTQQKSNGRMTINFPKLDFRVNRIYPFKRKVQSTKEKWFEKISFSYSTQASNQLITVDTFLFNNSDFKVDELLDQMKYGVRHDPTIDLSFKVFKYINVNPTITYNEKWYFYSTKKTFDPTLSIKMDTLFTEAGEIASISSDTTFGELKVDDRLPGFNAVREVRGGVGLNTQLFGIFQPKKAILGLKALKHIVKPNLNFSWSPDYSENFWGYFDSVQVDTRYPDERQSYNRFEGSLYGSPNGGKNATISYGLGNVLEAKVFSKKDTVNNERKIKLLNTLSIGGSYNLLADTLKWSVIRLSGSTTLFKKLNVTFNGIFDPYTTDKETNRRLNTLQWNENRSLARFTSGQLSINTSFSQDDILEYLFGKNKDENEDDNNDNARTSQYKILQSATLGYNLRVNRQFYEQKDSLSVIQSLDVTASFQPSPNWSIRTAFSYDFVQNRIAFPTITLSRSLHCWQMGIDWAIERKTWSFFLRVIPGKSLDFLNIPARKEFYDPF